MESQGLMGLFIELKLLISKKENKYLIKRSQVVLPQANNLSFLIAPLELQDILLICLILERRLWLQWNTLW